MTENTKQTPLNETESTFLAMLIVNQLVDDKEKDILGDIGIENVSKLFEKADEIMGEQLSVKEQAKLVSATARKLISNINLS
jgi:hypothetical protein